jgi:hypothetical protein
MSSHGGRSDDAVGLLTSAIDAGPMPAAERHLIRTVALLVALMAPYAVKATASCDDQSDARQGEIIADALKRSSDLCVAGTDCDASAHPGEHGWTVWVIPVKGRLAYVVGAGQYVLYDCSGKFERTIPGL